MQTPKRDRATKQVPTARCCWICGKLGGDGFTRQLRWFGYATENTVAHAHPSCVLRLQTELREARLVSK